MTQNQIAYWSLQETKRSNKAQEAETNRHNKAGEAELGRHNLVTEAETERHNRATELLTSQANAELARHNAATELLGQQQLAETVRSNQARENLQMYSNETARMQVGLGYAQLAETVEHDRNTEKLNLLSINETMRANEAREDETYRHNIEQENVSLLTGLASAQQAKAAQTNAAENATQGQFKRKKWLPEYIQSWGDTVSRVAVPILK